MGKDSPLVRGSETSTLIWTSNPLQMESRDENWCKYRLRNAYCPTVNIASRHFAIFRAKLQPLHSNSTPRSVWRSMLHIVRLQCLEREPADGPMLNDNIKRLVSDQYLTQSSNLPTWAEARFTHSQGYLLCKWQSAQHEFAGLKCSTMAWEFAFGISYRYASTFLA